MAITEVRARYGAYRRYRITTGPGNKTCRLLGAARGNHSRRGAITVNRSRKGRNFPRKIPVLPRLGDGTCGRNHADSCAGVTPYCSFFAVGYDISCGVLILS